MTTNETPAPARTVRNDLPVIAAALVILALVFIFPATRHIVVPALTTAWTVLFNYLVTAVGTVIGGVVLLFDAVTGLL
jgi:uncharacterized membrane protein